jgi:hypothetical protein
MAVKTAPQAVVDDFLFLCITDTEFLELARKYIPTRFLQAPSGKAVCEVCYNFYDRFSQAPNGHFVQELQELTEEFADDRKAVILKYVERFSEYGNPVPEVVLAKVDQYYREQVYEDSFEDAYQLFKEGQVLESKAVMDSAYKAGIPQVGIGLDWGAEGMDEFTPPEILLELGIPSIDREIGGLSRGQFIVLLGNIKGYKSWFLQYLALKAYREGKNVLYVSHENGLRTINTRFEMMAARLVSHPREGKEVPLIYRQNGKISVRDEFRPSVFERDMVKKAKDKLRQQAGNGRLLIEKYPMGTANMLDIEQKLDACESSGVRIDVLVNDYVDIQNLGGYGTKETRDRLNFAYMESKRLADERNMLVITCSQANRDAQGKPVMTVKDFAEDIRKAANIDMALGICPDEKRRSEKLSRIIVLLNREGPMKIGATIAQNIDIGEVVAFSEPCKV